MLVYATQDLQWMRQANELAVRLLARTDKPMLNVQQLCCSQGGYVS